MTTSAVGGSADAGRARRNGSVAPTDALHGARHIVQFYEDEGFLEASVVEYLDDGLAAGESVLVIATAPHRRAFRHRLEARGRDVAGARRAGRLTMLDARGVLGELMVGGRPDDERFAAIVEGALTRAARHGVPVRAYGEMVDLLVADGNPEGAVRLEELWDELIARSNAALLCTYAMGAFDQESHGDCLERIFAQHGHVFPTERYAPADEKSSLLEVARLQQRARALETEIARRAELERQLLDALAEQRRTVTERERLLRLEQAAREAAESANRARSEFLAMMSHELRTPLNAIGGHVQLIEMGVHGPLTDAQREALARVQRSQRHLLALINDVLNLVRLENGRVEFTTEDVALAPLVAEVLAMVDPLLAAKGLVCSAEVPPCTVRGDGEKVRQILLNLLTNAVKFTPAGGHLTVSVAASTSAGEPTRIRVCDTGIGIPGPRLASVFEPFIQIGTRTTTQHEGVGLGLAISRDLARGMGGDLTVESELGQGSTFTLLLPSKD